MIVKPTTSTYRDLRASLNIRHEFTRQDGVWMVFIGFIIAFMSAFLGLKFISPLGAVVWSLMGTGWVWAGTRIIMKGVKSVEVITYIKAGRANAVTRAQLVNLTGLSDRKVRKKIEHYRNYGIPIMSASDGKGYWLATTTVEIERFLREADNRARAQQYIKLRRTVAAAKGEYLVTVRQHYRRLKPHEVDGQVKL